MPKIEPSIATRPHPNWSTCLLLRLALLKYPKKLEKNRLYIRYEPRKGKYYFDVTGPDGKFDEEVSRYLLKDSVLPGEYVGGDKGKWYVFLGGSHDAIPERWDIIPNAHKAAYFTLRAFFPKEVNDDEIEIAIPHSRGSDFVP